MTTIGILGAGEMGSELARAAVRSGYEVVIANSRGPESLRQLVAELGPRARAARGGEAAVAGDFVILSFPYKPLNDLPVAELAGKVVLDTNNYMAWRDGDFAAVDSGRFTVHELRQRQLPTSKVVKAFTNIQAPSLVGFARPSGHPDRVAFVTSSDHPDAVAVVTRLYDEFGFDTVDNSPLSESWRSAAGTPMWRPSFVGQNRSELAANLVAAQRR